LKQNRIGTLTGTCHTRSRKNKMVKRKLFGTGFKRGKQHEHCDYCRQHIHFSLDETVFIHGKYYSKEEILEALNK